MWREGLTVKKAPRGSTLFCPLKTLGMQVEYRHICRQNTGTHDIYVHICVYMYIYVFIDRWDGDTVEIDR